MYAIVALGGKQYHLEPGNELNVELTKELSNITVGNSFSINDVLFIQKNNSPQFGQPTISGAAVKVTVLNFGKGKKIRVETYKKRKGKKRTYGHRQPFVKLRVEEIQLA